MSDNQLTLMRKALEAAAKNRCVLWCLECGYTDMSHEFPWVADEDDDNGDHQICPECKSLNIEYPGLYALSLLNSSTGWTCVREDRVRSLIRHDIKNDAIMRGFPDHSVQEEEVDGRLAYLEGSDDGKYR